MANAIPMTGGGSLPNLGFPYGVVSPTAAPDFNSLLQYVLGQTHPNVPSFQDALSSGINSPIFQSILGPALANLKPGEDQARQGLIDTFRQAGGLAPNNGALGVGSSRLENSLQQQRGNLISQVLQGFLPNLVSGYAQQSKNAFEPGSLLAQILGTARPQVIADTSNGGGGGGMGGSGGMGGAGAYSVADANFGKVPYGPTSPFGMGPGNDKVGYGSTNPGSMYDHFGNPLPNKGGPGGTDPFLSQLFDQYINGGQGGGIGSGISYDNSSSMYTSDPNTGGYGLNASDPNIWSGFDFGS